MSGYPPNYGYGAPGAQPPYGAAPPYGAPYGAPPPGDKPHKAEKPYKDQTAPGAYAQYGAPYGAPPSGDKPYKPPKDHTGAGSYDPYGAPYGAPPSGDKPYKPPKDHHSGAGSYDPYGAPSAPPSHGGGYPPAPGAYGNPFAALTPSQFPPGTDPNIISGFTMADQDRSGLIDDKELQRALSGYSQSFSLRTVHLLMYLFTNTNTRKIGPKEFTAVYYSLQNWRGIFERYDRDRSGKIDSNELREALLSLGFSVSPIVLDLLISKFDKSGGRNRAIEYDNFIECCLTVKGLTEKFKEKDTTYSGSASFTYEGFMLTVLPFLIA